MGEIRAGHHFLATGAQRLQREELLGRPRGCETDAFPAKRRGWSRHRSAGTFQQPPPIEAAALRRATDDETAPPHVSRDQPLGLQQFVGSRNRCPVQSNRTSQFPGGRQSLAFGQTPGLDQTAEVLIELPVKRQFGACIQMRLRNHSTMTVPYWRVSGKPISIQTAVIFRLIQSGFDMRSFRLLALVGALAVALLSCLSSLALSKKKKEEETQTLQLPKDPPTALTAETRRLIYQVTPLSAKGLLSQQTRDALKWLLHSTNGATIVKLRAFVAGSGDLRRVRELVSETFTEHKLPLPVLSVVQVGALPLEGAQVVVESTAVAKKDVNDRRLVYISAQGASAGGPLDPVLPLAEQSLRHLATAVKAAGSEPEDVLRVTCLLSSLDKFADVRSLVLSAYSNASLNFLQIQRAPV